MLTFSQLETVLFSVYYPAVKGAKSDKPKHLWVPKPLAVTAEGYAKFAHFSNFLTNSIFTVALWGIALPFKQMSMSH
jgi:platelet-activating factor acetylhydrolase